MKLNSLNFFKKIIFSLRKPKIIIVAGKGRKTTAEAVFCLLKKNFRVEKLSEKFPNILDIYKKEILICEVNLENSEIFEDLKFLIRKSQLPVLIITHFGDISSDKVFFAGEKKDMTQSKKIAKILPHYGHLILNFDDETTREIKDYNPPTVPSHILTFGFQEGADFRVTDINLNSGTNFKINYKGNTVPIWLEKLFGKEQIYSALGAAVVGTIFGLNLVEISNILKDYQLLSERSEINKK